MTQPYNTWTVRAGSTEPIEFELSGDGVAVSLLGVTLVELRLKNGSTGAVTSFLSTAGSPKVVVTDAANGKVTFYPAAASGDTQADLVLSAGHYNAFFWVTDAAGKKISFPTAANFVIRMIAAH